MSIFAVPELRRDLIRAPMLAILIEGSLRVLVCQLLHSRPIDGGQSLAGDNLVGFAKISCFSELAGILVFCCV